MSIGDDKAVFVLQGELAMWLARTGVVERCQCHGRIKLPFFDGLRLCDHIMSRIIQAPDNDLGFERLRSIFSCPINSR